MNHHDQPIRAEWERWQLPRLADPGLAHRSAATAPPSPRADADSLSGWWMIVDANAGDGSLSPLGCSRLQHPVLPAPSSGGPPLSLVRSSFGGGGGHCALFGRSSLLSCALMHSVPRRARRTGKHGQEAAANLYSFQMPSVPTAAVPCCRPAFVGARIPNIVQPPAG